MLTNYVPSDRVCPGNLSYLSISVPSIAIHVYLCIYVIAFFHVYHDFERVIFLSTKLWTTVAKVMAPPVVMITYLLWYVRVLGDKWWCVYVVYVMEKWPIDNDISLCLVMHRKTALYCELPCIKDFLLFLYDIFPVGLIILPAADRSISPIIETPHKT